MIFSAIGKAILTYKTENNIKIVAMEILILIVENNIQYWNLIMKNYTCYRMRECIIHFTTCNYNEIFSFSYNIQCLLSFISVITILSCRHISQEIGRYLKSHNSIDNTIAATLLNFYCDKIWSLSGKYKVNYSNII